MPGETVTFAANVHTNASELTPASVPAITFFMGSFHSPSNYQGMVLQRGGNDNPLEQCPLGEWRTVKTAFTADAIGADLTVTEGSFNIYQKGYQAALSISAPADVPAAVEIFIDNVRVYRDKNDLDKALASPIIKVGEKDTASDDGLLDGTFETDANLDTYGIVAAPGGTGTVSIDTSSSSPMRDGTNSLKITAGSGAEFVYLKGSLDAS
jgi:hypothetical protein